MPSYRDVDADLRINTLEARLAEREASLAARDAELNEYRALDRSVRMVRIYRAVAVCGVLTTAAFGIAFAAERASTARERAWLHDSIAMGREHQIHATAELDETKLELLECHRSLLAARRLPSVASYDEADRARLDATLGAAAAEAAKCGKLFQVTGTGSVTLVFEPLEGRFTSAVLDPGPLRGTPVEGCVLGPFRTARADAFKGAVATMTRMVTLR